MNETINIFVYGTLLKGMSRASILTNANFKGYGILYADLYDLGHFPTIEPGYGYVYGEIYGIIQQTLRVLDQIEGFDPNNLANSLYHREKVSIHSFDDGQRITAYTYVFNGDLDKYTRIESGDYRRYLIENPTTLQWYIAYGSNMNPQRLENRINRCPTQTTGYLEGFELIFNKLGTNGTTYANIRSSNRESKTPFVAYILTLDEIETLDFYEGMPNDYVRVGISFIHQETNTTLLGHIYIAHPDKLSTEQNIGLNYFNHIFQGYEINGFTTATLSQFKP